VTLSVGRKGDCSCKEHPDDGIGKEANDDDEKAVIPFTPHFVDLGFLHIATSRSRAANDWRI